VIWLWGLSVSLLLVTVLGGVFAMRHQPQRKQRVTRGSVTDWGQSLALVYELRQDIKRLSEENQRLWAERAELATVFARVVELLEISGTSRGLK
jgi:hypothetical protein